MASARGLAQQLSTRPSRAAHLLGLDLSLLADETCLGDGAVSLLTFFDRQSKATTFPVAVAVD